MNISRAKQQARPTVSPLAKKEVRKLFIGGIPVNATFEEFRNYFEIFGELTDALLPMKSEKSGVNSGFGFITFKYSKNAETVLENAESLSLRSKWVL